MDLDRRATDLPERADVVIVGAGHNALVAAAYLSAAGRSVVVLEQMARPGGWVQTAELGTPGFSHDLYGAVHSAFLGGPAWLELAADLTRHGLTYAHGPLASGASLADGRSVAVSMDSEAWTAELERLGERGAWEHLLASASWLPALFELLATGLDEPGARASMARILEDDAGRDLPLSTLLGQSAQAQVTECFRTEEMRFLAAPWALHYGFGSEDAGGALWTLLTLAGFAGGSPIPVGGSGVLVDALVALCIERGADIITGVDVDEVIVDGGRAHGVRTADGTLLRADEAVLASVTPDVLYGRLLREAPGVPDATRAQAAGFRYGRGCLQINLALSARPRFGDTRLDEGGAINLGGGIERLREMVRAADDGLLPRESVLSWHEPTAVDPTRAPEG